MSVFCRPDSMDLATARVLARKMARYRAEGDRSRSLVDDAVVDADLYKILGIDDPGKLNLEKLHAATSSGPPFEDHPSYAEKPWVPNGCASRSGSTRAASRSRSTSKKPIRVAMGTTC